MEKGNCLVILSKMKATCVRCRTYILNLTRQFNVTLMIDGGADPRKIETDCKGCPEQSDKYEKMLMHNLELLERYLRRMLPEVHIENPFIELGKNRCYMSGIDIANTLAKSFDLCQFIVPLGYDMEKMQNKNVVIKVM